MLELGGKSPVLIYDDADLAYAIPAAAMAIFRHSGQACVAGSRVFVQRGVYDQVVEGFATLAGKLRYGGPSEGNRAHSGPLISEKQLHRVLGYIDGGKQEGAEVVVGGHRLDRKGWFVHPTVFAQVRPEMRIYQEEIFGPVVAVTPFDTDDEVIPLANDSTYGLSAAVWTARHLPRPLARPPARRRAGHPQLPGRLEPRRALRRLQAVRVGLRERPPRPRRLPQEQDRLRPALTHGWPAGTSRPQWPDGTAAAVELDQLRRSGCSPTPPRRFAEVAAGDDGDLHPLRAGRLGRLRRPGRGRVRRLRHRGASRPTGPPHPDRAILEAEVVMMGGGNTFRLLDSPLRARRASTASSERVRAGATRYLGASAGTNVACPTIRTTNDMPICQPPQLRRPRPGAVPDQPPLRRRRPGLDLHGRDPRGADRGVPRGEPLPGAGHVRGIVAAGRRATGDGDGPGPAVPSGRAARPSTTASTCPTCSTSTPALRRRPAARDPRSDRPERRRDLGRTGYAADLDSAGTSRCSGRIRPEPLVASSEPISRSTMSTSSPSPRP